MMEEAIRVAHTIVETLEERKGEDILLLDIMGLSSFTDYFVLSTGTSQRTLKALAEEVTKRMKERHRMNARSVEGDAASGWVLIDYGDVILHLFSPKTRAYYNLEDLWGEGQVILHIQ
jgi:ribosome-associated protein